MKITGPVLMVIPALMLPPGNYDGGLGVRSDGGIRWRGGGFTQINNDSYKVSDRILFSGNGTDIFTNQTNKSFVGIRGVRDAN